MTPGKDHLCQEHSGVMMWMKINALLISFAIALLSYSSFIQVPNLRYDLAKDMTSMENDIRQEVQAVKDRVSRLEAKVIRETP